MGYAGARNGTFEGTIGYTHHRERHGSAGRIEIYEVRPENGCTTGYAACRTLKEARDAAKRAHSSALSVEARVGIYRADFESATEQDPADCLEIWEDGKKVWNHKKRSDRL